MSKLQKGFWRFILGALMTMMVSGYCSAATAPGTLIGAMAHMIYADSAGKTMPTLNSNNVTVTVVASSSMSFSVDSASKPVSPGGTAVYKLTIQNTGGAADSYNISYSTTATGWQSGIFVDSNNNGTIDTGELKSSAQTPSVAANSSYSFYIAMTAPSSAAAGSSAGATVSVASMSSSTAKGSVTLTTTVQSSSYIRKWTVLGPIAASGTSPITYDYLVGEANAVPGIAVGNWVWTALISTTDLVDLGKFLGGSTNSVAYAGVFVYSDTAQSAVLNYTSTGASQVWLNGSALNTQQYAPADSTVPYKVPVQLFAGWNRLILKLGQATGQWQYGAVFTDSAGTPLASVRTDTALQPQSALSISSVVTSYMDSSNATVQWTTNAPTSTIIKYASATSGNLAYQDPVLALQHTAKLSNLQSGTTYTFTPSGQDAFGYGVTGLASSFSTAPATSSIWITNWLVNGTYSPYSYYSMLQTDYLQYEPTVQPYEGLVSGGNRWTSAAASSFGIFDFLKIFPRSYRCCGYAHVYVYSPSTQYATLLTGSNDGIKAWLNGRVILNKDVRRYLTTDHDRTSILLAQGWNRLLIKVSQFDGAWQMCARIVGSNGGTLSGLQYRVNKP